MSLRRLDSIIAELLPKLAERYTAQQVLTTIGEAPANPRPNQDPTRRNNSFHVEQADDGVASKNRGAA